MAQNPTVPDDGTTPGPTDWFSDNQPSATAAPFTFDQLNALYQRYLGRAASQAEYQSWASGAYGQPNLSGIEQQIKTSGEAQTYAQAHPSSASTGAPAFLGFDASRAESAKGSLKYDAMAALQKYSPNDPDAAKKAFAELNALHPGQYEFDKDENILLTGTADGYIGARPQDRNTDWNDRSTPWAWQWMAYNEAHRGPNGEGSDSGSGSGSGSGFSGAGGVGGTGSAGNRYGLFASGGNSGGALGMGGPGGLYDYGVPYQPYQSSPYGGPAYQAPTLPASMQTPYEVQHYAGGDFTPPAIQAALRKGGGLYDPEAALPHFANGVTNFSGGNAVVGEQGPELVTLPPGSSVTPNRSGSPWDDWTSFYAPSADDMYRDPGYQSRLAMDQQARERSAAARGSILSGGTQLELGRAAQDYASNEYANVFNRSLLGRQQNVGEYNTKFNDALATYNANYGRFQDEQTNALLGRQSDTSAYATQANVANQAYQNPYKQYLDDETRRLNEYLTNYGIGRTGVQDFLNQNNTVAQRGLNAALGGRP